MADYATKGDITKLEDKFDGKFDRIDQRFDELVGLMSQFANDVNDRFDRVEKRLDEHDEEFRKLNKKYDHLLNTIDSFLARIDKYETEAAARDHKIERLERWMEQIASKTGIKLDYN